MSQPDEVARRFRRRAASRRAAARQRYLTPELRAEAEALQASLDKAIRRNVRAGLRRRVDLVRMGFSVEETRKGYKPPRDDE